MKYYVESAGQEHVVEIETGPEGTRVLVDGKSYPADIADVEGAGLYSLIVGGESHQYGARFADGEAALSFHDREVTLRIEDERTRLARLATGDYQGGGGPADIKSVMPGVVKEIRVEVGDEVQDGQALLILEAMKMENEIRATHEGVIQAIHVKPGEPVEKGAPLVTMAGLE